MKDLVSDAGGMLVGVTEFRGEVEDVSMRMREPFLRMIWENPVRL